MKDSISAFLKTCSVVLNGSMFLKHMHCPIIWHSDCLIELGGDFFMQAIVIYR